MILGSAIAQLRLELNDPATTANPEGKRFSNALFANWLNAGVALAYHFRKDLFMQTAVVKATVGDLQKPCGFDRIHKVEGLSDECGNIIKPLEQSSRDTTALYPKRCLPTTGTTSCPTPDSFSIDQNVAGQFSFNPPVAQGADVFYRVTGSVPPKPYDCNLEESICHSTQISIPAMAYARHMAYMTETESTSSRSMADQQFGIFLRLLGIMRDADKQYCKEFCKA